MSYTPQGPADLLNRIGFTYKKTAEEPCKAGAQKQEKLVEEFSRHLGASRNHRDIHHIRQCQVLS
ncbi:MAG: winged helix-turn-helix domain-containing protein [Prevotella sp.]